MGGLLTINNTHNKSTRHYFWQLQITTFNNNNNNNNNNSNEKKIIFNI